ncbi:MAG: septum site-determining protein MinC [Clostridiales bacterium]|jgi:septum site-determining protein MinC|nr:septum site-determining protein MinC [Clostridiales bacterium]
MTRETAAKDNIVMFKGRGDGLTVILDDVASFKDLEDAMAVKIADARSFLGAAETALSFAGRRLSKTEEDRLVEIIKRSSNLSVRTAPPALPPDPGRAEAFTPTENPAAFHVGSLRSGQSIRFAGSVVVLGDVNPGAEIVAEGNIIVLGSLKGMAHAGCSGLDGCFIAALRLVPTQIRIADRITYIPKDQAKSRDASYAYVEEGRIFIAPLGPR